MSLPALYPRCRGLVGIQQGRKADAAAVRAALERADGAPAGTCRLLVGVAFEPVNRTACAICTGSVRSAVMTSANST